MGLRSIQDHPELAAELRTIVLSNPGKYPDAEGAFEALNVIRVAGGWQILLGLENQGESGVDVFVSDSDSPQLTSFR